MKKFKKLVILNCLNIFQIIKKTNLNFLTNNSKINQIKQLLFYIAKLETFFKNNIYLLIEIYYHQINKLKTVNIIYIDELLKIKFYEFGPKWKLLEKFFPGRTSYNIRNRWNCIVRLWNIYSSSSALNQNSKNKTIPHNLNP